MQKQPCKIALLPFLMIAWLLCSAQAHGSTHAVIILPFRAAAGPDLKSIAEGLTTLLPSRISIPGKIRVVDATTLKKSMGKDSLSSRDRKIELARRLKADFIIDGTITKNGEAISVDALVTDVRHPDKSSPVPMQAAGIDRLIPETDTLADKIKAIIVRSIEPEMPEERISDLPTQTLSPSTFSNPQPLKPARIEEQSLSETDMPSLDQAARPADRPARKPAAFEPQPFMTQDISATAMQTITSADIDADGKRELVLSTDDTLYFYGLSGTTLEKKGEFKTGVSEHIVDVSAADLNGNGVEELYVTCYEGRYANSFVLENSTTGFKRIADNLQWFFRLYEQPGEPLMLLGQKADGSNPFQGTIVRFRWQDGKLRSGERLTLPEGLNVYAFAAADFSGDGSTHYVGFNKTLFSSTHQLSIYSPEGRMVWRDPQGLGGSPRTFMRRVDRENLDRNEVVPLRIICEDINRDKSIDILVAKNVRNTQGLLKSLGDFYQGTLMCMQWDGLEMTTNWTSPLLSEYISDYMLADMNGDGTRELYILSAASSGFFGRATNTITGFRIAR